MKIDSSVIGMSSSHSEYSYTEAQYASITQRGSQAVSLDLSDESKSLMEQMQEKKEEASKKQAENMSQEQLKGSSTNALGSMMKLSDQKQLQIEILRKMIQSLQKLHGKLGKNGKNSPSTDLSFLNDLLDQRMGGVASINGTNWTKTTVASVFHEETENTAFESTGMVRTADGREINFGVSIEMSRAFCEQYESLEQTSYITTDPLVINLDTNVASVSDQKFLFDIDSDGKEDSISFAGQGSGFLALDKNGDGTINDGSELFGTKSGDGFADLAAYDKDGNGWIDESDDVFSNLQIWTKDENGKDSLISLKDAGVGAIYLGKAATQFSLNDAANHTNGYIRSTGIYLKENGQAGTMQHVDLTL